MANLAVKTSQVGQYMEDSQGRELFILFSTPCGLNLLCAFICFIVIKIIIVEWKGGGRKGPHTHTEQQLEQNQKVNIKDDVTQEEKEIGRIMKKNK